MDQKKKIVVSIVVAVVLIGGALVFSQTQKGGDTTPSAQSGQEPRAVTNAELASGTGVDGHPCYVAVDGTVYQISNSILWVMGVHTPTKGLIKCGFDHSQTILNSPHGKSKLKYLDVIGTLVD